jgi:hypothetical protein
MAVTATPRGRSVSTRRVGYFLAVVINVMMLDTIHVWPGWRELPILTEDMSRVLGLITL